MVTAGANIGLGKRALPAGAAALVLGVSVIAGLAVGGGGNTAVGGILNASARSSNVLGNLGSLLGLGFAFGAGMVATVNPCGFVMLPTYLGLYVGTQEADGDPGVPRRLLKAASVSVAVGLGFVVLFGSVGIVLSAGARSIVGIFPWVGLAIGFLLGAAGAYVLGGGKLYASFATQAADRIGDPRDATMRGYFLFGISYALASLSCTLPIFLALVSSSLATGGFVNALGQFLFYALGMSLVIAALTVSVALAQGAVAGGMRRLLPHMNTVSAVLLLIAGGYIVFYWLTEGGLAEKIL